LAYIIGRYIIFIFPFDSITLRSEDGLEAVVLPFNIKPSLTLKINTQQNAD